VRIEKEKGENSQGYQKMVLSTFLLTERCQNARGFRKGKIRVAEVSGRRPAKGDFRHGVRFALSRTNLEARCEESNPAAQIDGTAQGVNADPPGDHRFRR
jgi:hypothetical protein